MATPKNIWTLVDVSGNQTKEISKKTVIQNATLRLLSENPNAHYNTNIYVILLLRIPASANETNFYNEKYVGDAWAAKFRYEPDYDFKDLKWVLEPGDRISVASLKVKQTQAGSTYTYWLDELEPSDIKFTLYVEGVEFE